MTQPDLLHRPVPVVDPGLTEDPIADNPMPAPVPATNEVAAADEPRLDKAARRRWVDLFRRDQLFGRCILLVVLIGLLGAGVLFRRRRSESEEEADGFTEEGPPPLE